MGEDRRSRRRRRRARAEPRPAAGRRSTARSTSSCRATGACRCRPGRPRAASSASRIRSRPTGRPTSGSSTSRRTATGSGSSIIRRRSIATGCTGRRGGDFADNAWRFGLLCRAALETLRAEADRPVDVIHLHDWHAGPAAIQRDAWLADDPVIGRAAIVMTLHNLAYHGWTGREPARASSGSCRAAASSPRTPTGST